AASVGRLCQRHVEGEIPQLQLTRGIGLGDLGAVGVFVVAVECRVEDRAADAAAQSRLQVVEADPPTATCTPRGEAEHDPLVHLVAAYGSVVERDADLIPIRRK